MSKSSSNYLQIFAFAAMAFLGCNKESSQRVETKSRPEVPAKLAAKDSIVPKSGTSQPSFNTSLEGYKASILGSAIYSGSLEKFIGLIQQGASIEKCLTDDTYVFDALYAAIAFGKKDIVEYMVKNKLYTDINKSYTEESETALTLACAIENKADALEISTLLISNKANVDGAGSSGSEDIKIPIFIAVNQSNVELVRLLISKGAKKDITNSAGASPLMVAEERGLSEIISLLKL